MNKTNLIYISNTRVPSEKANTYQSMVMCEALSKHFDSVEFWYPNRKNTKEMKKIDDPFEFYGIKKSFVLNKIFSLDLYSIGKLLPKIWFLILSISFAINYIFKLKKLSEYTIVFTRDSVGLNFLSFTKRFGITKQKVFFEAHIYSTRISKNAKNIDGLVVINHYLKNLYEKDGIHNILVAHDGVKIETFKEIDEYKAKEMLRFENDTKYLTYIGRFNTMGEEKGIPEIIESFSYIKKTNAKLLFVGGPLDNVQKYYKIAEKFNVEKEKILFMDRQPVSELYKYISASSVLLMPFPWTEHYAYFMSPLKMFEYMASKRPIVASLLPSIEEVLVDKKNAILCEPDNPKDLADKIQYVLANDCSEIVKKAYGDVQEYTWDKRVEHIFNFIKVN